jgi:hypothetical protein
MNCCGLTQGLHGLCGSAVGHHHSPLWIGLAFHQKNINILSNPHHTKKQHKIPDNHFSRQQTPFSSAEMMFGWFYEFLQPRQIWRRRMLVVRSELLIPTPDSPDASIPVVSVFLLTYEFLN